jgi:hypothetical protein
MPEIIPALQQTDWQINGDSLTVWINDFEMLDITPSPQEGLWVLRCNHVAGAQETYLGIYGRISHAQGAAKTWIGDDSDE